MVNIVYDTNQFLLAITIAFMLFLMYIGEFADKKDHLRRGLSFMFTWIIGMFGGIYFIQSFEWYIPFVMISLSGFYALRGFINLGMAKRVT